MFCHCLGTNTITTWIKQRKTKIQILHFKPRFLAKCTSYEIKKNNDVFSLLWMGLLIGWFIFQLFLSVCFSNLPGSCLSNISPLCTMHWGWELSKRSGGRIWKKLFLPVIGRQWTWPVASLTPCSVAIK